MSEHYAAFPPLSATVAASPPPFSFVYQHVEAASMVML